MNPLHFIESKEQSLSISIDVVPKVKVESILAMFQVNKIKTE